MTIRHEIRFHFKHARRSKDIKTQTYKHTYKFDNEKYSLSSCYRNNKGWDTDFFFHLYKS